MSRPISRYLLTGLLALTCLPAKAANWQLEWNEQSIAVRFRNTVSLGAAWRLQTRDEDLVGKANLPENRNLCAEDDCIALTRDNTEPNRRFLAAPGGLSMNIDDGNLNYDAGDTIAAVAKWSARTDIDLGWGDVELSWLYFHDTVNSGFREIHPNEIVQTGPQPGQPVRARRARASEKEIGNDLQLRNANLTVELPFNLWGERSVQVTIGQQLHNWGVASIQLQNLNFINPPNLNNLNRPGAELWETYTPVGMLHLKTQLNENLSLESFYQYDWRPLELPPRGSYLSFFDVGTTLREGDHFPGAFGKTPQDPNQQMRFANPLLRGISDSSLSLLREPNREPRDGGQYGFNLGWTLPELGPEGTRFSFIHANYHARIPSASARAAEATCARREGNPNARDSTSAAEFNEDCQPDLAYITTVVAENSGIPASSLPPVPGLLLPDNEPNPGRNALPADTATVFFEYPEDIRLWGLVMETIAGNIAWQAELAWRPNQPVQVDAEDVLFAALQPALPRESIDISAGFPTAPGVSFPDATLPSSREALPDFVTAYRGGTPGEVAPRSYVRGYERMDVWSASLTATRVLGESAWLGATQLVLLAEMGAIYLPGLPDLDELQFEAPGTHTHASPGIAETGNALKANPVQTRDGFVTDLSYGYTLGLLALYSDVLIPGLDLRPFMVFRHDLRGVAPGLAENFVAGRKFAIPTLEVLYGNWSATAVYSAFFGAGDNNTVHDRDYLALWVSYEF